DIFDHPTGDKVLQYLSMISKKQFRGEDIITRYGGEEFVVLLDDCDKKDGFLRMETFRKYLEEHPLEIRDLPVISDHKGELDLLKIIINMIKYEQLENPTKEILWSKLNSNQIVIKETENENFKEALNELFSHIIENNITGADIPFNDNTIKAVEDIFEKRGIKPDSLKLNINLNLTASIGVESLDYHTLRSFTEMNKNLPKDVLIELLKKEAGISEDFFEELSQEQLAMMHVFIIHLKTADERMKTAKQTGRNRVLNGMTNH
ncbi:MAG: diguanylate cyclase, partial [Candidatus Margulisbacteria bacterium]|nr:diguanylate cyclase [Candidatus Margulisiibacteriota bacterium]